MSLDGLIALRCEAMKVAAGCADGEFKVVLTYADWLMKWLQTGQPPAAVILDYKADRRRPEDQVLFAPSKTDQRPRRGKDG